MSVDASELVSIRTLTLRSRRPVRNFIPAGPGHQVRRYDDQLRLDLFRHLAELVPQQAAALLAILYLGLFRAVIDDFAMSPGER